MIIISHRGNLTGPDPATENTIAQIMKAIDMAGSVEVDVWGVNGVMYLGHDMPGKEIAPTSDQIYYHCKNKEAAVILFNSGLKYFIHDQEDYALTSNGLLWTYPGQELNKISIAVLPDSLPYWDISNAYGICTDYPLKYKQ